MELIKTKKITFENGWKIDTDFDNNGVDKGYPERITDTAVDTQVPSLIQESFPMYHGTAWYWKKFDMELEPSATDRVFVRICAADYVAWVWMNGKYLGKFEGGETAFEFDVTDCLKDRDNLLAIKIINPCERLLDGYNTLNIPRRNKRTDWVSGYSMNMGGIYEGVDLLIREAVAVTDVFAECNIHTGDVKLTVSVDNYSDSSCSAKFTALIKEKSGTGKIVAGLVNTESIFAGKNTFVFNTNVKAPRLWNLDDPYLYGFTVICESEYGTSEFSFRYGFRELKIVNGFFNLNGKRIFLKCSHDGICIPKGVNYTAVKDFIRRDFINAKACGFNAVRAMACKFRTEMLDFCDEIGIMIIEENFAGWLLGQELEPEKPSEGGIGDNELMLQRFDHNTECMILHDRNHASVTIYELLNETNYSDHYKRARDFLPRARELDPSRLILLSSGRFDREFEVGCTSNPYVNEWERFWGADAPTKIEGVNEIGPSVIGAGDVHSYPSAPYSEATYDYFLRTGEGYRPVFFSEFGIGTQFNVIQEAKKFAQYGYDEKLEDYTWLRNQSRDLERDFSIYGFDRAYPTAEAMLNDSQRLGARQRNLEMNLLRANPQICGTSYTGLLDHGMCGEGLWSYWRIFKPGMFDAIADGYSDLRFCTLTYPTNAYSGRPFRLKISLATEDVLRPGTYPSTHKIMSEDGKTVWERHENVVIPESMPFAVPIIDEKITLNVPTGKYTVYSTLDKGGTPTGQTLMFYITDPKDIPVTDRTVYTLGISDNAKKVLNDYGIKTIDYNNQTDGSVLVGDLKNNKEWQVFTAWKGYKGTKIYECFGEGKSVETNITCSEFTIVMGQGGLVEHSNALVYVDSELVYNYDVRDMRDGGYSMTKAISVTPGTHNIKIVAGEPRDKNAANRFAFNTLLYKSYPDGENKLVSSEDLIFTNSHGVVENASVQGTEEMWNALHQVSENGHTVAYISAGLLKENDALCKMTGFGDDFDCHYTQDFLYHKEYVVTPHPIFDGIPLGIMDLDYVGQVFPHESIYTDGAPESICPAFVTGSIWEVGAYRSSYGICRRPYGKGHILISTFYLLATAGDNPVADRMLVNLAKFVTEE